MITGSASLQLHFNHFMKVLIASNIFVMQMSAPAIWQFFLHFRTQSSLCLHHPQFLPITRDNNHEIPKVCITSIEQYNFRADLFGGETNPIPKPDSILNHVLTNGEPNMSPLMALMVFPLFILLVYNILLIPYMHSNFLIIMMLLIFLTITLFLSTFLIPLTITSLLPIIFKTFWFMGSPTKSPIAITMLIQPVLFKMLSLCSKSILHLTQIATSILTCLE